jgi:hypothetical protein
LCSRMRASLTGLIDAEECDLAHIPFGAAPPGGGHGGRRVARQMRAAQVKIRKSAPPYGHSASAASSMVSAADDAEDQVLDDAPRVGRRFATLYRPIGSMLLT